MADLEKTLAQRFQELNKERTRLASANVPLRDKLLEVFGKDPAWVASIRRKQRASRKSVLARRLPLPKVLAPKERVHLGSIGGTRVSPFDYYWKWSAKTGSPPVVISIAQITGGMLTQLGNQHQDASASARAAVGIFFQSPSECLSNFSFWANPSMRFQWQHQCFLASAHSDGFIGLFAASYDWAGNFTGTLADQMISLWSHDSWWQDASGSGSASGFPLSANFQVDPDHWYALWVWCGSHISGDGDGTFSWGSAFSVLNVYVPSISWQVG